MPKSSAAQATGVAVDLEAGAATDTFGDIDTLTGFENVVGTTLDDVILGNSGNNRIHGHDGNDLLDGRSGDDIIIGGDGQDIIIGGTGNDILTGDGGNGQFAMFQSDKGEDPAPALINLTLTFQEVQVVSKVDAQGGY